MTSSKINIKNRNKEVQETLNTIPGWILKWGNSIVFLIILILLTLSYIIKYPDVQTAKIEIIRTNNTDNTSQEKFVFRGIMNAEQLNLGKIKEGQKVLINLANYPSEEFGAINGVVGKFTMSRNEDGKILIPVKLSNKMVTSSNKLIEFNGNLYGTAEIITEDLRFIERIFYRVKGIFLPE